jgi:hypothetical protein
MKSEKKRKNENVAFFFSTTYKNVRCAISDVTKMMERKIIKREFYPIENFHYIIPPLKE